MPTMDDETQRYGPYLATRLHVVPVGDVRPHECSLLCWCKPTADAAEHRMIVHNSGDGREFDERELDALRGPAKLRPVDS